MCQQVTVGMEERESLPVGFLDFILGGFGFNAESIVELCFCYHCRVGKSVQGRLICREMVETGVWSIDEVLKRIGVKPDSRVNM